MLEESRTRASSSIKMLMEIATDIPTPHCLRKDFLEKDWNQWKREARRFLTFTRPRFLDRDRPARSQRRKGHLSAGRRTRIATRGISMRTS